MQGSTMRVASDTRWTWIFATVLILVVLVVIGFLLGITGALSSIDDGLKEADASVTDINGDAKPLPGHVQDINANLTKIDVALKPITGQADDILGSLKSIDGSLTRVNSSLGNTSGSLVDTSSSLVRTSGTLRSVASSVSSTSSSLVDTSQSLRGTTGTLRTIDSSLKNTSGVLVNVTGLVRDINRQLVLTQREDSRGTALIPKNVARANGILGPVEQDATNINQGLDQVNNHLTSICKSNVLKLPVITQVRPGPDC